MHRPLNLSASVSTPPDACYLDAPQRAAKRLLKPRSKQALEAAVLQWIATAEQNDTPSSRVQLAVDALGWVAAIPQLTDRVSAEVFVHLMGSIKSLSDQAANGGLEHDPLVHQLLYGELPLRLAEPAPEKAARALATSGRKAIGAGLMKLVDQEGLPRAENLRALRPLLACWTRCRILATRLPGGGWNRASEKRYQQVVLAARHLADGTGRLALADGSSPAVDAELLPTAMRLSEGGERGGQEPPPASPAKASSKTAWSALHSEEASTSVLRTDWSAESWKLAVTYPGSTMEIELDCGKQVVYAGTWDCTISCDGMLATPTGNWSPTCWVSDEDGDYLELSIDLAGGTQLQRHLFLGRKDGILFLADAVLGGVPGQYTYCSRLPLGPGVGFKAAKETRDGFLTGPKNLARVLPLALSEWQADPGCGSLCMEGGHLQLVQKSDQQRVFSPLFFDLDPVRNRQQATWRQLTVAESLVAQPIHIAAGYRVATGKKQWLIYRSLAAKQNRTLLGHNLATETLLARFEKGEIESIMEID